MMKKYQNYATILLCGFLLFGLAIFAWIKAPGGYSNAERRTLAQLPKLTLKNLESGRFMSDFEDYTADQFPMRDGFRSFKAVSVKYVFGQKDNNGLYSVDGYLSKLEYPLNETRLKNAIDKINSVQETYLSGTDCTVYLSLIPDKNMFLAPMDGYPCIDFDTVEEKYVSEVKHDTYIDIYDLLSIDDFYLTDQHWKQESILDVAKRIGDSMTGEHKAVSYVEKTLDREFYGAYVGQSALPSEADTVTYLTNEILESCAVTDYNSGKAAEGTMYDLSKGNGKDAYELFLSGSTPLIVIENPNASTDKELIVFRDSFGSSLIPLLADRYAKITVVDLRYMKSEILGRYIEFDDQDVLFLYSTLILNNVISA